MAKTLIGSAPAAVCEIGFEEPTKPVAVVRAFWNQPQKRLQMAGPVRTRRGPWVARSSSAAASFAATNIARVGCADSTFAALSSDLGQPEAGGTTASDASQRTGSVCPHDWQLVEKTQAQSATATPFPQRPETQSRPADSGQAEQSRLDCGFQGLVPHYRWAALRSLHPDRQLQSLFAALPSLARPPRCNSNR